MLLPLLLLLYDSHYWQAGMAFSGLYERQKFVATECMVGRPDMQVFCSEAGLKFCIVTEPKQTQQECEAVVGQNRGAK